MTDKTPIKAWTVMVGSSHIAIVGDSQEAILEQINKAIDKHDGSYGGYLQPFSVLNFHTGEADKTFICPTEIKMLGGPMILPKQSEPPVDGPSIESILNQAGIDLDHGDGDQDEDEGHDKSA